MWQALTANLSEVRRTRPIVVEATVNGTTLVVAEDLVLAVDHLERVKARVKAVKMALRLVAKEAAAATDHHAATGQGAGAAATLADTIEERTVDRHQAIKIKMGMRREGADHREDFSAETSVAEEEAEDDLCLKTARARLENRLVRMDPEDNNVPATVDADHHVLVAETPSPSPEITITR